LEASHGRFSKAQFLLLEALIKKEQVKKNEDKYRI
jgi:hypothetical protein